MLIKIIYICSNYQEVLIFFVNNDESKYVILHQMLKYQQNILKKYTYIIMLTNKNIGVLYILQHLFQRISFLFNSIQQVKYYENFK